MSKKPWKISDSEDEDDDEIFPLDHIQKIKSGPQPEEPILVQGGNQHLSSTVTRASQSRNDEHGRSKKKTELEMRLRDIELEREVLQIKKQLLELED